MKRKKTGRRYVMAILEQCTERAKGETGSHDTYIITLKTTGDFLRLSHPDVLASAQFDGDRSGVRKVCNTGLLCFNKRDGLRVRRAVNLGELIQ